MPPGALLIHGFTATPECLEPLARPLREKGWHVETPLLAGHGTSAFDLQKTRWEDWYHSVEMAWKSLKEKTGDISIAGLSLGGLLALKMASERRIKHLAVLATPIIFEGFTMKRLLPILGNTFLRHFYPFQPKWLGPAINDPKGRKAFKSYFLMPLASVMEITKLQELVRNRLEKVTSPTLILHSRHDTTAPFASVAYLENHLGSRQVHTIAFEKSNHVLTLDYDSKEVISAVVDFFGGKE